jgi:hypothetical protein
LLLDGGVRCGQDVLKALALGARASMVGRATLYGLAAAGEAGVHTALQILRNEMAASLCLLGKTDVSQLDEEVLLADAQPPPNAFAGSLRRLASVRSGGESGRRSSMIRSRETEDELKASRAISRAGLTVRS